MLWRDRVLANAAGLAVIGKQHLPTPVDDFKDGLTSETLLIPSHRNRMTEADKAERLELLGEGVAPV